ncbi:MAG: hypothetical protein LBK18_06580 [Prevotellaceae bacterium]|jgi:hypothetical protein|nr:hypothetical protein [Prevotellaceae bacterium]
MKYDKVKKNSAQLLSLTGFTAEEFEAFLPTFKNKWEEYHCYRTCWLKRWTRSMSCPIEMHSACSKRYEATKMCRLMGRKEPYKGRRLRTDKNPAIAVKKRIA